MTTMQSISEDDVRDLAQSVIDVLDNGYEVFSRTPSGKICGLLKMMFTTGLVVGISKYGYERRYCYEHFSDALDALKSFTGEGDPSGPWIKEKPGDRLGPGALKS